MSAASSSGVFVGLPVADKKSLYGLLDTYFASRARNRTNHPTPPPTLTVHEQRTSPVVYAAGPVSVAPTEESAASEGAFVTSYPPKTTTGSSASDFGLYFDEEWQTTWYDSNDTYPPPLRGRSDLMWSGSMQQMGNQKSITGTALFCDLSQVWYRISWSVHNPRAVSKEVQYSGRPSPLDLDSLIWAHQTYGELIAAFAEDAHQRRQPVGAGECWDVAHHAIKNIADNMPDFPAPVPSINRTHGHLIFEGKAWGTSPDDQIGRWRGGDDQIRRGDVVEWRTVTIRQDGAPRGSWSTLGSPEHTAVIVSDSVAATSPSDGGYIKLAEFGTLEVIEQSQGKIPSRVRYDLTAFQAGECWIYRPVALMQVGREKVAARWPPPPDAVPLRT